jgi:hypothetical protein
VTGKYLPTCSTPNPPFDVSLPACIGILGTSAVLVQLAGMPAWRAALTLGLAVALAARLRRRWRRAIAEDPGCDLYMVLQGPLWSTAVAMLAAFIVPMIPADPKPAGPIVGLVLFSVGSTLPSAWLASWLSTAAARGGPLAPGTMTRRMTQLGVWRTGASTLWPVLFFGVADTMKGPWSVAALLTALAWLTVVLVGVAHLRAAKRPSVRDAEALPAAATEERAYRELQERPPPPEPAPAPEPEADLEAVRKRELRADIFAFVAVTIPLGLHVLLLFVGK